MATIIIQLQPHDRDDFVDRSASTSALRAHSLSTFIAVFCCRQAHGIRQHELHQHLGSDLDYTISAAIAIFQIATGIIMRRLNIIH